MGEQANEVWNLEGDAQFLEFIVPKLKANWGQQNIDFPFLLRWPTLEETARLEVKAV